MQQPADSRAVYEKIRQQYNTDKSTVHNTSGSGGGGGSKMVHKTISHESRILHKINIKLTQEGYFNLHRIVYIHSVGKWLTD